MNVFNRIPVAVPLILFALLIMPGCQVSPTARLTAANQSYGVTMDALNTAVETGTWAPDTDTKATVYQLDAAAYAALLAASEALAADPDAEIDAYLDAATAALTELQSIRRIHAPEP